MMTLKDGPFGMFLVEDDRGRLLLVQQDWDYPRTASMFGWQPCACGHTDGTIDCPHKRATDMIWDAYEFLDTHVGARANDRL